ncbi:MAG: hypothetical protein FJX76_01460 [Armatimonadetes bacterium]|nr:hypothetical protein [Armatimonadota bacterium]
MATSGSYNFSLTAAQIIQAAWEDLGILQPGGTIVTAHQTMALSRLNMLAKQWQARSDYSPGMPVWSRQRVWLFLALQQMKYHIGPASGDSRATTAPGRTTIRADEAAGQTVLDVTARTDTATDPGTTVTMTDADIIGVVTDKSGGDDIHWSTISSSSGTGPTVTLASALPTGQPAGTGNYVYWFTARAQRFPHIETAVLRNSSYNDTPLAIYRSVDEYEEGVADKYSNGDPSAMLVEPLVTRTRVTLNSRPTDVTKQIVMTVLYPAEDYDATTDDIAFPQEAYAALSWELAFRCASSMGVNWTPLMAANHKNAVTLFRGMNPEVCNLYFQPGGV